MTQMGKRCKFHAHCTSRDTRNLLTFIDSLNWTDTLIVMQRKTEYTAASKYTGVFNVLD